MASVKCNKGGLSSLISYVDTLKSKIDGVFDGSIKGVKSANDSAIKELTSKKNSTPEKITTQENGVDKQKINPDYTKIVDQLKTANDNATKISSAMGKKSEIDTILNNVKKGLEMIQTAINDFESKSGDVVFDVKANTKTVVNAATGIEVKQLLFDVTGPDGKTRSYTISELLNSYYTVQGMEMNGVYQAAILRQQLGLSPLTDEDIQRILQTSKSVVNFAFDLGLYGVATQRDLDSYKKSLQDAGFKVSTDTKNLINGVDFMDDDLKNKALKYLGSATNGAIFPGAVSAAVTSLYGLYNNDSSIQKNDSDSAGNPGSGNYGSSGYNPGRRGRGYSGNGGDSSSTSTLDPNLTPDQLELLDPSLAILDEEALTEELPTELIEDLIGETETPLDMETEPLVEQEDVSELPTEEIVLELDKNYDDFARLEYESKGEEFIATRRADLTELANKIFDDKETLRLELQKYGYSEDDITVIMADKGLTIAAMITGDERQQLTQIAIKLAEEDGVKGYDTVYDNEWTANSLRDGSSYKLLNNMINDENVLKAYQELTTAEKDYKEANSKAVEAMKSFNEAQAKLKETTDSIGIEVKNNPAQWSEENKKLYNDDVTKLYNESVTKYGEKKSWTVEQTKEYNDSISGLKDKYALQDTIASGKVPLTKEQAKKYNDAVKSYNEAAKSAKEEVAKINSAKENYTKAKTDFDTAKEDFYNKTIDQNTIYEEVSNDILDLDAATSVQDPEIVLPDEATDETAIKNYDIDTIDVSSYNSGTINNEDIPIG